MITPEKIFSQPNDKIDWKENLYTLKEIRTIVDRIWSNSTQEYHNRDSYESGYEDGYRKALVDIQKEIGEDKNEQTTKPAFN